MKTYTYYNNIHTPQKTDGAKKRKQGTPIKPDTHERKRGETALAYFVLYLPVHCACDVLLAFDFFFSICFVLIPKIGWDGMG